MNELNYATLEAGQRLVDAGIVLETEAYYVPLLDGSGFMLAHCCSEVMRKVVADRGRSIPAPSMAEVWRELPLGIRLYRGEVMSEAYMANRRHGLFLSENPTDALIDLLIWVTEQRKEKP